MGEQKGNVLSDGQFPLAWVEWFARCFTRREVRSIGRPVWEGMAEEAPTARSRGVAQKMDLMSAEPKSLFELDIFSRVTPILVARAPDL